MLSFIRVAMVMVSLQSNRAVIMIEVGTMQWGVAVSDLTLLLADGMWTLEVWTGKAVECFK